MPKRIPVYKHKKMKLDFLNALENNLGIISISLKQAGVSRHYYIKWMDEDPDFKAELDRIEDKTLDYVESKLFNLITEGDKTAILFYLKCKGKDRGYIEKQYIEQETTFKHPLTINVIPPSHQIEGDEQKKLNS